MNAKDAILVGLCFIAITVLGSFLLLLDPAIHAGFLSFLGDIVTAMKILFFVGVGLGGAAIGVKIWKGRHALVIKDGKGDQIVRAVVVQGTQVIQIGSAEGFGLNELLQMQGQLIAQQQKTLQVVDSGAKAIHRMIPLLNEYEEDEEEIEDETKLIEAPKVYTLSEQLQGSATQINEDTSIVGYVEDEQMRGKLFDDDGNMFDSVFVLGDQGFGKSTFATYLAALTILHHGRVIVIDPDAEFGQSLSVRLGPLACEIFLLCPIADTPEKAARAVSLARDEIESPSDYPVLWLIDEFSMIMRQALNGTGKWAEVGKEIAELTEDWATRGRKRRRRVVAFGQIPNAKRTGGTEFRDSCTVVAFHLKKKRAQMVLEGEDAELAPDLGMGEVIVIPARSSEASYRMQLPYPDVDGLRMIAQAMAKAASGDVLDGSEYVKEPEPEPTLNHSRISLELPSNQSSEPFIVDHETAFKVKVRRIRDMRNQNKNQSQIIEAIYGVKKGGSPEYAKARDEYFSIINLLASTEGEI
jgi:energy-coupling factor transporter ATP-binding protein EcfA2